MHIIKDNQRSQKKHRFFKISEGKFWNQAKNTNRKHWNCSIWLFYPIGRVSQQKLQFIASAVFHLLTLFGLRTHFTQNKTRANSKAINLPALFKPGPKRRGICLMTASEARKAWYFLASFFTSFLFLLSFFSASTSM